MFPFPWASRPTWCVSTCTARPAHIVVGSNLLGDQQVMLNMLAWLEFSMKTYFYLGMPLQNVALRTSTYAHTSAFEALAAVWNPVMNATQGTRTISRESILDMLPQLADTAQYDRAFTYWLQALLLDAGYDSMVLDALYSAADWADGFLAEDGIQVTVTDQEETWTTGDLTLFHRDGDGWTLALPATGEGYTAHATMTQGEDSRMLRLCFGLEEEADVLDLTLSATGLPTGEDGTGRTELALDPHWLHAWGAAPALGCGLDPRHPGGRFGRMGDPCRADQRGHRRGNAGDLRDAHRMCAGGCPGLGHAGAY